MALNIAPGYYQAKLRWRQTGDPEEMISTLGLHPVGGDDPRDVVELAHAVWAAWTFSWGASQLSSTWQFVGVDVYAGAEGPAVDVGSWDEQQVGTNSAGYLPQNCALLIKKRTALGGRAHVGRMFLPSGYLPEGVISNSGVLDGGQLAAYQGFMNNFYDSLMDESTTLGEPTAAVQPTVFHNNPGLTPTPVTALTVDATIATQRQRLRH